MISTAIEQDHRREFNIEIDLVGNVGERRRVRRVFTVYADTYADAMQAGQRQALDLLGVRVKASR